MYNSGIMLKCLLQALIMLQPYLLFCESFCFRCRSRKHFSVARFICTCSLSSPTVLGGTGCREEGMVRTSEARSLLSNKPAQMLNAVLILNDFSVQLVCTRDQSPPKAMPEQEGRVHSLKKLCLLLAFSLVYSVSSKMFF